MLNIPRASHRFFLEPLSGTMHIIKSLKKRYINFIERLRKSKKEVLRSVLRKIENDCRSTTGRNIRKLLLESDVYQLSDVNVNSRAYNETPKGDEWKIDMVEEILNVKTGYMQVPDFTLEELNGICEVLCST